MEKVTVMKYLANISSAMERFVKAKKEKETTENHRIETDKTVAHKKQRHVPCVSGSCSHILTGIHSAP